MVVDDLEEFEARRETDVGDRRMVAADEGFALEEELVERGERFVDRRYRRLLRLRFFGGVASLAPTSPGYCGKFSAP